MGLYCFQLKKYQEATKRAAEINVISRPYNGSRLAYIPGKLDTINHLLALIQRTARLPDFYFKEKNSVKYETFFGKHEGVKFPSMEIPSILGFEGVSTGNGIHIGYKMNTTADKLMKIDHTKVYYRELALILLADKHLMFGYANTFECQYVCDVKVSLL